MRVRFLVRREGNSFISRKWVDRAVVGQPEAKENISVVGAVSGASLDLGFNFKLWKGTRSRKHPMNCARLMNRAVHEIGVF